MELNINISAQDGEYNYVIFTERGEELIRLAGGVVDSLPTLTEIISYNIERLAQ